MAVFVPVLVREHREDNGSSTRRVIFLRAGRHVRKVYWKSGTLWDLLELVLQTYNVPLELMHVRSKEVAGGYVLTHSLHREGYHQAAPLVSPDILRDGSVVSVRDPLWQAACMICAHGADGAGLGPVGRTGTDDDAPGRGMPPQLQKDIAARATALTVKTREESSLRNVIDLTLNDPASSTTGLTSQATVIGVVILMLIVLSTITFCLETLPWYYDPDGGFSTFFIIESVSITVFTLEFATRFAVCSDRRAFMSSAMNQIDFIAVLPFYLDLLAKGIAIPGLSVLRVTRLARVFRLLKVSKDSLTLLGETMSRSARPLHILGFLLAIFLVMFSSVMFYAERGTFDASQGKWMRTTGFQCDYVCSPETRKLLRPYLECAFDGEARAMYFEKFTFGAFPDLCERVTELSPFQSIVHSMWFTLVTMTTVGYGDMFPRSLVGYLLAGLTQMVGILVIALPVTVIGSNFSSIYDLLGSDQEFLEGVEPTLSVVPGRLHASSQGATHPPVTRHWLSVLTQEWDLDVCYKELLPCKPPVPSKSAPPPPAAKRLSAKEEYAAFIEGKDLTELVPRSRAGAGAGGGGGGGGGGRGGGGGAQGVHHGLTVKSASMSARRELPPLPPVPRNSGGGRTMPKGSSVKFDALVPEMSADARRHDALVDIANRLLAGSVRNAEMKSMRPYNVRKDALFGKVIGAAKDLEEARVTVGPGTAGTGTAGPGTAAASVEGAPGRVEVDAH